MLWRDENASKYSINGKAKHGKHFEKTFLIKAASCNVDEIGINC